MSTFDATWEPKDGDREPIRMGVSIVEGRLRTLGSYPMSAGPYMSQNDRFFGDPKGYLLPVEGIEEDLVTQAENGSLEGVDVFWTSDPSDTNPRRGTLTMFESMIGNY